MSEEPQDISAVLELVELTDAELLARGIERRDVGQLFLPSGRLIVSDPTPGLIGAPLTRAAEPGRYPATLYKRDGWNAFAVVRFSDRPVTNWELARVVGEEKYNFGPGKFYGCAVDSGFAGFMDVETPALIEQRWEKEQENPDPWGYVATLMEDFTTDDEAGIHHPIAGDPRNVAVFKSGFGDGSYPVLWGFDEAGNAALVLCDFRVVTASTDTETSA